MWGIRSAEKKTSARRRAPGVASVIRCARREDGGPEAAEVDGAERGAVEHEIGPPAGPARDPAVGSALDLPAGRHGVGGIRRIGQQLQDEAVLAHVRSGAQQVGRLMRPEPDVIVDGDGADGPRIVDRQLERVVDGDGPPRGDGGDQVDAEQGVPQGEVRFVGHGDQFEEVHLVGGPSLVPLRADPVGRVALVVAQAHHGREAVLRLGLVGEGHVPPRLAAGHLGRTLAAGTFPDGRHVDAGLIVPDETNGPRLGHQLVAQSHGPDIDGHPAHLRGHAVAEAAVDGTLGGSETGHGLAARVDVCVDRAEEAAKDPLAPMGGGDGHPRHPSHGHRGAARHGHVEGERARHTDDLRVVECDAKARQVHDRQPALDFVLVVEGAEAAGVGGEHGRGVGPLRDADLDGHGRRVWPASATGQHRITAGRRQLGLRR